jgi:hypothetical protein
VTITAALAVFSSLCFIVYAIQSLTSERMRAEFERFGLPQLRRPISLLQVLAGIGLLVGMRWQAALTISAGGLTLMMVAALIVRVRIKDGVVPSLPAFVLMAVNGFIFFQSLWIHGR